MYHEIIIDETVFKFGIRLTNYKPRDLLDLNFVIDGKVISLPLLDYANLITIGA